MQAMVAAWTAKIFWLSTEAFSSDRTLSLLSHLLGLTGLILTNRAISVLHLLIRKAAHIVEYSVLAVLLCLLWNEGGSESLQPKIAGKVMVVCAGYALLDELHQYFVQGRGPSLADCGLDILGALMSVWMFQIAAPLFPVSAERKSAL